MLELLASHGANLTVASQSYGSAADISDRLAGSEKYSDTGRFSMEES